MTGPVLHGCNRWKPGRECPLPGTGSGAMRTSIGQGKDRRVVLGERVDEWGIIDVIILQVDISVWQLQCLVR